MSYNISCCCGKSSTNIGWTISKCCDYFYGWVYAELIYNNIHYYLNNLGQFGYSSSENNFIRLPDVKIDFDSFSKDKEEARLLLIKLIENIHLL